MKQFVYLIDLKNDPELIAKYKKYHQNVWPEVSESIRNSGILHMRIYLLGTKAVNIIDTTDDYDPHSFKRSRQPGRLKEWDDLMAEIQMPVADAKPGEWWALTQKIYDSGIKG